MKKAWIVLGIFLISQAIAYKVLPHDGKPFMFGDFVTITLLLVILSSALYELVKLANSEKKALGNRLKQIKTLKPTTPPPPPPPPGGTHVICISHYGQRCCMTKPCWQEHGSVSSGRRKQFNQRIEQIDEDTELISKMLTKYGFKEFEVWLERLGELREKICNEQEKLTQRSREKNNGNDTE